MVCINIITINTNIAIYDRISVKKLYGYEIIYLTKLLFIYWLHVKFQLLCRILLNYFFCVRCITSIFIILDKADPFDKEKQTIDALLSQWTEEDIPESELTYTRPQELPCFNSTVIEATDQIFKPITAVPVAADNSKLQDSEAVIVELGITKPVVATNTQNEVNATNPQNDMNATNPQNDQDVIMEEGHIANHGEVPKTGQYLPVEGGYIYVDGNLGT